MKLVIDISGYNAEWIRNAYGIPQEINTNIAESIINAEPYSDWVPVTERLPEENGEYLCQEKQGFLYVDAWNGEYWECADSALGIVIAWMPLPEPWKGEVTE